MSRCMFGQVSRIVCPVIHFCNLSVTNAICRGCLIADIPAIVGSLDFVMGEVDR